MSNVDGGIVSYAYLSKNLTFSAKFTPMVEKKLFNNLHEVYFFEATSEEEKKQVRQYDYFDSKNFCIRITTTDPDEMFFIIKSESKCTVANIISSIKQHTRSYNSEGFTLNKNDIF